tara:strand:+ start:6245 stop:7576 length:1332 start_codon:yes stop_codon:yes gene_type:complete
MYALYKLLTYPAAPFLSLLLKRRCTIGKESRARYSEKRGITSRNRPKGKLLWIHGASVGEAQSALILIEHIQKHIPDLPILVTTGTLTSAHLMEDRLPHNAFHQFYPLDHPTWVKRFLDHWNPDAVIWMESELWPNMLHQIKGRAIPSALVNARMSSKSFRSWKRLSSLARSTLSTFDMVLCQTDKEKQCFDKLGARNTITTDNLKYSAQPLTFNKGYLNQLKESCQDKRIWLYASTHAGEERIAHDIHIKLKQDIPDLLTIIVPRHPERRHDIQKECDTFNLKTTYRGEQKNLPKSDDDIYIADTLGELGLLYQLSPIACIGRSLSDDGGGGHNPIEAAQMGCGVIHGQHIQNLQPIYDEMNQHSAALSLKDENALYDALKSLFENEHKLKTLQENGRTFSKAKTGVIDRVMKEIEPLLFVLQDTDDTTQLEKTKHYATHNA